MQKKRKRDACCKARSLFIREAKGPNLLSGINLKGKLHLWRAGAGLPFPALQSR